MAEEKKERKNDKELEAMGGEKKLKYPMSVFFIIGNEFCERFSYYGMKAILSIYLRNKLHFDEHTATSIYHGFTSLCYFTPIFGALLADMFLGKFKTIVYISVAYVLGHLLKTIAAIPTIGVEPVSFSLIGLALIALGTGGIKPCVSAFGGDQFKLPEQARLLQTFFSVFYFSINAGSLISTVITPVLREDVECFGDETCYSLAFGIPAILMFIATVIIVLGKPLYVMKPPQGNILPSFFGSIFYALREKFSGKTAEHWLDLAKAKYDDVLVEDVKSLLRVLVIYIPLPVWWALFDQTGSRWTFQATRMNGVVGATTIKPDQMQVANPLMILLFIPLFDKVVYPAFAKFGFLVKPLQRMTVGGILTAASFFISGFLELELQKTYAKIPAVQESHVFVMNNLPCNLSIQLDRNGHTHDFFVPPLSSFVKTEIDPETYSVKMSTESTCMPGVLQTYTSQTKITTKSEEVNSILVTVRGSEMLGLPLASPEEPHRDDGSNGRLRVIQMMDHSDSPMTLHLNGTKSLQVNFTLDESADVIQSEYQKIEIGEYRLIGDDSEIGDFHVDQGGVYNLLLHKNHETGKMEYRSFVLTVPNSVHILWLIPQYVIITMGEVMFSITGLEFSYSQAPDSMKSVVQAAWLLTVGFGNVLVIIVAEVRALSQANEFFMFACLMLVDMGLFAWLAHRYKPREKNEEKDIALKAQDGHLNSTFKNDD